MVHSLIVGKNNYHSQKIIKFSFQRKSLSLFSSSLLEKSNKIKYISSLKFNTEICFLC